MRDQHGKHMRVHYNNVNGEFKYTEIKRFYSPATTLTGGGVLVPAPAALSIEYIGSPINGVDAIYDRMYMALQDTAGNVGVMLNPDANAAKTAAWTQWLESLTDISAAGTPNAVNLQAVTGLCLALVSAANTARRAPTAM